MFHSRSPPTPGQAVFLNGVAAFVIIVMLSVISLDGNREQEAFNRGAIYVTIAASIFHAGVCMMLHFRGSGSSAARLFLRFGSLLLIAALVIYFALASFANGRVM